MKWTEELLPDHVLKRATRSGNEYAWRPADIPDVIEAARDANLVSLGGQLQFLMPGATCECYWVQVDASEAVTSGTWAERVGRSAEAALADFQTIGNKYDFLAEGREAFGEFIREFEANGGDASDAMYFVWSVETEKGLAQLEREWQ